MAKTIWVVSEEILDELLSNGNSGYYSTREKAIEAVYNYLAEDFEEDDLKNKVEMTPIFPESPDGNVEITTHCGDDYGMYDCRYYIEEVPLNREFGT